MQPGGEVLTPELRRTLERATARVLPASPASGPGADEAHVIGYIEWVVGHSCFATGWDCLRGGTRLLDQLAAGLGSRSFADSDPATQDEVLRRLESTPHPTAQRFLQMLVRFTLAGCFCDPKYGGNRAGVGWHWIGFRPDEERAAPVVNRGRSARESGAG